MPRPLGNESQVDMISSTSIFLDSTHCASLTSAQAANILFGRHLYPRYIEWQATISDPDQVRFYDSAERYVLIRNSVFDTAIGNLPHPEHFKAFMNRIKLELYTNDRQIGDGEGGRTGEGTETDMPVLTVANICGHSIHPGNPAGTAQVCPVCIIRECVASLLRIACLWRCLGGPHGRLSENFSRSKLYNCVKKIWHAEKNRWSNLVFMYSKFAVREREWEEQHERLGFATPDVVKEAKSCTMALEIATRSPFLAEGWDDDFVPADRGINSRTRASGTRERATSEGAELLCSPPYCPASSDEGPLLKSPGQCEEKVLPLTQHPHEQPPQLTGEREDTVILSPTSNTPILPPSPCSSHPSVSSAQSSSEYVPSPAPPPSPSSPAHTPPKQRKHVTFAADVSELATRPSSSFRRKSVTYTRGRHASPEGTSWEDTSFYKNAMFDLFDSGEDEADEVDEDELERLIKAQFTSENAPDVEEEQVEQQQQQAPSGDEDGEFDLEDDIDAAMLGLGDDENHTALPSADTNLPRSDSHDGPTQTANGSILAEVNVQGPSRRRKREEFESDAERLTAESEAKRHCP
ncbi:uncharacterized protein K460DRAFT_397724 [Cucurbitaria berberidis CBS 394.84]|uniref:Uncharacterized protein n=1 Tax=Cucurbitaria berberidis CBS 394.84 TaxID=1168544 RepID=A0A9P4L4N7_9PLEO|nr:uncharacterized protein K460DRAFT_397724 [Cucurbitaria berberidis CBS 394.84]KAF1841507.1 hypothetical protein K460DRAFT_397724 [Cucurbitaria berberidis CBS 394.84]